MLSMHQLTGKDDYRYLTRQVAAGDAPLAARDSLTAYYAATGNPRHNHSVRLGRFELPTPALGERCSIP